METGNHELSRNASYSQMSLRDSSPHRSSKSLQSLRPPTSVRGRPKPCGRSPLYIGTMVTDEDDDRAFFARNVVQCVSLAIGGRKPELRRRRVKNALGSCCRHIAPPCVQIYADDGLPGHSFQSLLASRRPVISGLSPDSRRGKKR